jgi:hypothetical protein
MRVIHYMVRRPEHLGELIYPLELFDPGYYGYGSFFIDGHHIDDVDQAYLFYAVRDDQLLPIELRSVDDTSFEADVDGVGLFIFKATRVGVPARYAGQYPFPPDTLLVRQLAPKDRPALEQAAHEHDFYFTGYSPQIGESSRYEPLGPEPRSDRQKR